MTVYKQVLLAKRKGLTHLIHSAVLSLQVKGNGPLNQHSSKEAV